MPSKSKDNRGVLRTETGYEWYFIDEYGLPPYGQNVLVALRSGVITVAYLYKVSANKSRWYLFGDIHCVVDDLAKDEAIWWGWIPEYPEL